jgi:hypothetical protein
MASHVESPFQGPLAAPKAWHDHYPYHQTQGTPWIMPAIPITVSRAQIVSDCTTARLVGMSG